MHYRTGVSGIDGIQCWFDKKLKLRSSMPIDHLSERDRITKAAQRVMIDRFYEHMHNIRKNQRAKSKETEVIRENEITEQKRIDAEERHRRVRETEETVADVIQERKRIEQKIRINRTV